MALQYLYDPNKQFVNPNGTANVGGFLRIYINGTDDRATTYKDFDGTLNTADIVLDANGRAVVIADDSMTYRIEVYSLGGSLMWTVQNFTARGGSGGGSVPVSVEGTVGEVDVDSVSEGGVMKFVVSLSSMIKNAISTLQSAVNGLALSLSSKKEKQTAKSLSGSTTKTLTAISQDENGEMSATFDDIAFPDWTSAINDAVAPCEKTANRKDTLTGYESSTAYYPSIKAVVDFVNAAMQNLGGKLITDGGDPFTDSSDLPSTTPYGGVDIADKDYAYVQGVGTAERWSATVTGSSVVWVQEYAISIPVFTPQQQAAIDSGITAAKIDTFLTKTGDGSDVTATFTAAGSRTNISTGEKLSVIFGKIAKWFSDLKAVAFSGSYNDLSNTPTIPTELPVKIEEIGGSAVDLDTLTASDMKVHYYTWSNSNRGNVSNKPTDAVYTIKVFPCGAGSAGTYVMQEAYKRGTTERYVRRRSDGVTAWSSWQLCTYSDGSYPNMNAGSATHLSTSARLDTWSSTYDQNNPYVLAGEITWELGTNKNNGAGQLLQFEFANSHYALIRLNYITKGNNINTTKAVVLNSNFRNAEIADLISVTHFKYDSDTKFAVRIYIKFTGNWQVWSIRQLDAQSGDEGYTNWVPMTLYSVHGSNVASPTGTSATYVFPVAEQASYAYSAKQISDNRGTEGQDGYKAIYGGYNNDTSEFGLGISKRENGETKYTEINADGITSSGIITAGVGFVGNLNGVAQQAVADSDGILINTNYVKKKFFKQIEQYVTQDATFHDADRREQLGPKNYLLSMPFSSQMMFYAVINFIDIAFSGGYDYSAVDFELYNGKQSGTYGTLMASVGMIVQKGTSSVVVPIPFSWAGGSFEVTLYGLFTERITAGSAIVNSFYYGLPT